MSIELPWSDLRATLVAERSRLGGRRVEQLTRAAQSLRGLVVTPQEWVAEERPLLAIAFQSTHEGLLYECVMVDADGLLAVRSVLAGRLGVAVPPSMPKPQHYRPQYLAHEVLEALFAETPSLDLLTNESVRIMAPFSAPDLAANAALADARVRYQEAVGQDHRRHVATARQAIEASLPTWLRAATRAWPVERSFATYNFYQDPEHGPRRRQALETYPAAAYWLHQRAFLLAIDAGEPLGPVLAQRLGLSKVQVSALRSPVLARSLARVDDGRFAPILADGRFLGVLKASAQRFIPERLDALVAALRYPEGWSALGAALRRYPADALMVDGAPLVPGFSDDGRWDEGTPASQTLLGLRDTTDWLRKSLVTAVAERHQRLPLVVQRAAAATQRHLDGLRPRQLKQLDDDLHRLVNEERQGSPASTDPMPQLTPNRDFHGVRFTQLRTPKEFTTEGQQMAHCVATYAGRAARGLYAVWQVESGTSRATLGASLVIETTTTKGTKTKTHTLHPHFDQIRLARNGMVTPSLEKIAREWLAELDGLKLSPAQMEIYEVHRRMHASGQPAPEELWLEPLYERIRERLWAALPAKERDEHLDWNSLIGYRLREQGKRPAAKSRDPHPPPVAEALTLAEQIQLAYEREDDGPPRPVY